jgi:phenylpropionate dioxygenase-like ring-hydroxylating dioxygenase large terminal subunit
VSAALDRDLLNREVHFSWTDPELNTDPPWHTGPVSPEPFYSREIFEREREKIFKQVWLNVARDWELPDVGDYVVRDIAILNASIILVRGRDRRIRAYHNTCVHRGNKIFDPTKHRMCGKRRTLACVFHGWVYDLEGRCVHVPDERHFYDFDKAKVNLLPVRVDTWCGHVFINMAEKPDCTLAQWLGEFGRRVGPYPWDKFEIAARWESTIRCNYKVFIDAFQETYHVSFIHKRSFTGAIDPDDPHFNLKYARFFGPHKMLAVPGRGSPQTDVRTHEVVQGREVETGLNHDGVRDWGFDIDVIFPNYFLNMFDNQYFTHNFWPIDVDRTLWVCHLYLPKARNATHLFELEREKVLLRDAIQEDLSTNEATQASLMTGAMKAMYFSKQECGPRHHYHYMEEFLKR